MSVVASVKPTIPMFNKDSDGKVIFDTCIEAFQKAGYTEKQIKKFTKEATGGKNRDKAIIAALRWCDVD